MPRTLITSTILPEKPDRLFDMYLDPEIHAGITGAAASIGARVGSPFRAFGELVSGKVLQVVPKRLIVQSWRAANWHANDLDSTLVLSFWPDRLGGRIDLLQTNIPDHDFGVVCQSWDKYYWTPWKAWIDRHPE